MSKYLFLILFTINSFSQQDRKIIYVDSKQDYLLLLEKETKITNQIIEDTNIDVFVNASNNKFNYTLIISKITSSVFINGDLLNEEYEKYLKDNCNCTLLEPEIVIYNNLKSVRYNLKTERENSHFKGYIDSFVSNSVLYNVLFLTYENNFESMKDRYIAIMNTLFINGKTTIDNYKE